MCAHDVGGRLHALLQGTCTHHGKLGDMVGAQPAQRQSQVAAWSQHAAAHMLCSACGSRLTASASQTEPGHRTAPAAPPAAGTGGLSLPGVDPGGGEGGQTGDGV